MSPLSVETNSCTKCVIHHRLIITSAEQFFLTANGHLDIVSAGTIRHEKHADLKDYVLLITLD